MHTKTAERQELYRVIDTLPDDSITHMLEFIRSLRNGFPPHTLNAETVAAMAEYEQARGKDSPALKP